MVFSIILFYADITNAYHIADARVSGFIRKSVLAQHIRFCINMSIKFHILQSSKATEVKFTKEMNATVIYKCFYLSVC